VTPAQLGVRRVTLFAAINHLARMSDPRVTSPPEDSLKAISDAVALAYAHDEAFAAELSTWVQSTVAMIGKVKG
jgi:hypothetical protein